MTDHQEFEALLIKAGLNRKEFAKLMGMEYTSLTNQLAPSKPLPRWAKSVLIIINLLNKES